MKGSGIRTLKVRLPQWAVSKNDTEGCDLPGRSFVIEENGTEIAVWPDEDGYLTFDRDFSEEIVYEAEFAFRFRIIRSADIRERAAVAYGPYIMAALSEEKGFLDFPFTEEDIEEKMKLVLHIVLLLILILWKITLLLLEIEIQWNR